MSRQRSHVAVAVHNKWRDFPGALLLRYWLETDYGYRVTLLSGTVGRPPQPYWQWIDRVRPDAIVFPKIIDPPRYAERFPNRERQQYRPAMFVLPTEGMLDFAVATENVASVEPLDLTLAWNDRQRSFFVTQYGLSAEQITVTGNPRFDWYHPIYRGAWYDRQALRERLGIPRSWTGAVATISCNFALANLRSNERELVRVEQSCADWGFGDPRQLRAEVEANWARREAFLDLAARATKTCDRVWIAVKPHPMEHQARYEALQGMDRLTVVKGEFPFHFLGASDLHIHYQCTTAIEASLLEVPTVNYDPPLDMAWTNSRGTPGSIHAKTPDEVLSVMEHVIAGTLAQPTTLKEEAAAYGQTVLSDHFGASGRACARAIHTRMLELASARNARRSTGIRRAMYERWLVDTFASPREPRLLWASRLARHLPRQIAGMTRNLVQGRVVPPHTLGSVISEAETEAWLARAESVKQASDGLGRGQPE